MAGANHEVAMCGGAGECGCAIGIGVSAAALSRVLDCKTAWQGCVKRLLT